MKKYLMIMLSVACLMASPVSDDKNVSAAVAAVNGVSITAKELEREVGVLLPKAYFHGRVSGEKLRKVELEAVDNLIDKELLLQEARSKEFVVTKEELDAVHEKIVTGYGGEKNLETVLKRAQLTKKEFLVLIEEELTVNKLLEKEVKVEFTADDIKQYYENNREKFKEPERLKVRLIVVKIDPTDVNMTIKAKSRIDEAYEKIQNGEKFADVAAKYSHDMTRIKGGDLGYIHKGMLDSRIEEKVQQLKTGEVSKIIKTEIGFSIVKLEEKKPARQLSYETVKERLITERTQNVQKKRRNALLERLKNSAKIEKFIQ